VVEDLRNPVELSASFNSPHLAPPVTYSFLYPFGRAELLWQSFCSPSCKPTTFSIPRQSRFGWFGLLRRSIARKGTQERSRCVPALEHGGDPVGARLRMGQGGFRAGSVWRMVTNGGCVLVQDCWSRRHVPALLRGNVHRTLRHP